MLQTFICKTGLSYGAKIGGGTIANANEVPLLDAGAFAILDEDGNLVASTAVAADVANSKTFRFAVGQVNSANGALLSTPIHKNAFAQTKATYKMPIKQVITLGNVSAGIGTTGMPLTLIPGNTADLVLITVTPNTSIHVLPKRFSVTIKATDTQATLLNRLITLINADDAGKVIASAIQIAGVTTGITLTAADFGQVYKVGTDGVMVDCTVYTDGTNGSVLMVAGRGTYELVLAAEKEAAIQLGDAFRFGPQAMFYKAASLTTIGATYNSWSISQENWHDTVITHATVGKSHYQIFAPVGSAIYTTLNTLLPAIFGAEDIQGVEATAPQTT